MDCTFTVPAGIAKFSHSILTTLIATFLNVPTDMVGVSARWAPGDTFDDIPKTVMLQVPDQTGKTCNQIGRHVRDNYDPFEDDKTEMERTKKVRLEAKLRELPVIQDILQRLETLEAGP